MTNYHLKPPNTALPHSAWQEKKMRRKRLLETVKQRRRVRYQQFLQALKNRQLQVDGDLL